MQMQCPANQSVNASTISSLAIAEFVPTKFSGQHSCMACIHESCCIAKSLEPHEVKQFNSAVTHSRRLGSGEHLYRMWDPVKSVFTVLSGSIKTYTLAKNGREQILGFFLPGELVAIDAIGTELHPSSAVALEKTIVCEIPVRLFAARSDQIANLQHGLIEQISSRLRYEEQHSVLLGQKSAEQRLAMFLVDLTKRRKSRGYASGEFLLTMSRCEIGNYLGLAMETVSRTLTRFQQLDLITVKRKRITINDIDRLEYIAARDGDEFENGENVVGFHRLTDGSINRFASAKTSNVFATSPRYHA